MDDLAFVILMFLIVFGTIATIVIMGIVFLWKRFVSKTHAMGLTPGFEIEDIVGQLFYVLGVALGGLTLGALNRDFGVIIPETYIALITGIAAFVVAYWKKIVYLVPLGYMGVIGWYIAKLNELPYDVVHEGGAFMVIVSIMAITYVVGRLLEHSKKWTRFSFLHSLMSIFAISIMLFFLSMQDGIREFANLFTSVSVLESPFVATASIATGVTALGLIFYGWIQKRLHHFEGIFLIAVMMFLSAPVFSSIPTLFVDYEISSQGFMWALIFNIAIFAEFLGLIYLGYLKKQTWYVNVSIVGLFILILTKYFDWFFSFLDKSVFFVGAGILFFIVGWFMERGRRYIISEVTESHE